MVTPLQIPRDLGYYFGIFLKDLSSTTFTQSFIARAWSHKKRCAEKSLKAASLSSHLSLGIYKKNRHLTKIT